jgi:uncharacterized protein (DUF1330 family)
MNARYLMTLLAGVAIGAIGLQGLHAQGAKLKAYSVSESEVIDASALAAYLTAARKASAAAHGRSLRTSAGRVVQIEGAAPKSVGIVEWDSLDDAVASTSQKPGRILHPCVIRQSRSHRGSSSKPRSSSWQARLPNQAASSFAKAGFTEPTTNENRARFHAP